MVELQGFLETLAQTKSISEVAEAVGGETLEDLLKEDAADEAGPSSINVDPALLLERDAMDVEHAAESKGEGEQRQKEKRSPLPPRR